MKFSLGSWLIYDWNWLVLILLVSLASPSVSSVVSELKAIRRELERLRKGDRSP